MSSVAVSWRCVMARWRQLSREGQVADTQAHACVPRGASVDYFLRPLWWCVTVGAREGRTARQGLAVRVAWVTRGGRMIGVVRWLLSGGLRIERE